MSYCRWSGDNFQCDVYVYADCMGGWTTHVAGSRYVERAPDNPDPKMPFRTWKRANKRRDKWFDRAVMVHIGLPYDGASFNDSTPGECAHRLVSLQDMGYNVPQYVIDALNEEQAEEDTS